MLKSLLLIGAAVCTAASAFADETDNSGITTTVTTISITDVLDPNTTGYNDGVKEFKEKTGLSVGSDAQYTMVCGSDYTALYLSSSGENRTGIITTKSAGKAKKVIVQCGEKMDYDRKLNIYGSSEPYTGIDQLYTGSDDTLLGTMTINKDNGGVSVLEIEGDYPYIGIRVKSSYVYVSSIKIVWETEVEEHALNAVPVIYAENGFVYMTSPVSGVKILYTTDGSEPTMESEVYAAPLPITGSIVYKAMLVLDGICGKSVEAAFNVSDNAPKLEDVLALPDDSRFLMGSDLSVLFSQSPYTYVTDGKTYSLILLEGFSPGQSAQIASGWTGKITKEDGLTVLVPDYAPTATAGSPVALNPMEITGTEINEQLAEKNLHRPVKVMRVVIDMPTPVQGVFYGQAECEGSMPIQVVLNNVFGVSSVAPGTYDITGFVGISGDVPDLRPISFEASKSSAPYTTITSSDEGIFYTLQGIRVQKPAPGVVYLRVLNGQTQKVVISY